MIRRHQASTTVTPSCVIRHCNSPPALMAIHGRMRNFTKCRFPIGDKVLVLTVASLVLINSPPTSCFSPSNNVRNNMLKGGLPTSIANRNSRSIGLKVVSPKEASVTSEEKKKVMRKRDLPRRAWKIYWDYFSRLWTDTSTDARKRIAKDKATAAIRRVENVVRTKEYFNFTTNGEPEEDTEEARVALLAACHQMMDVLEKNKDKEQGLEGSGAKEKSDALSKTGEKEKKATAKKKEKKSRSVLFGAVMGAVVACWVFSGNYIFTFAFTLMTILGQLEYYRMVINTGVYPARRISVVGACSMFLTALWAPNLHQICLPMFGLWAMIWFLTVRRQVSSIPEIATTFTGMFLLGYVPSFWVRTRLIGGGREPTRLAPIAGPVLERLGKKASSLPPFIPQAIHLPITTGAIFIFWTWLCIAFSDVGAYFVGRRYGRTKLGEVAPAAGATSPNKTVEGVFGGCAVSAALGVLGAWVQKWPYWILTGALHGTILGLLGLIGDLTASMLKRDAGFKDFGDLIPEHGGIMDRVDSFVFAAPYSWLVCAYVIPALKTLSRSR